MGFSDIEAEPKHPQWKRSRPTCAPSARTECRLQLRCLACCRPTAPCSLSATKPAADAVPGLEGAQAVPAAGADHRPPGAGRGAGKRVLMAALLDSDFYLRLAEVEREVGLGRPTIYRRMREGTFPLARQLGGGSVRRPLSARGRTAGRSVC